MYGLDGDPRTVIRLVGIDAPEASHSKNELGQPFSDQATKRLASLVLNRSVEIKAQGQDRYGRTSFRVGSWALLEGRGASTKCAKGMWAASGADRDGRGSVWQMRTVRNWSFAYSSVSAKYCSEIVKPRQRRLPSSALNLSSINLPRKHPQNCRKSLQERCGRFSPVCCKQAPVSPSPAECLADHC